MINRQPDERILNALHCEIFGASEENWPAFLLIDPSLRDPLGENSDFASCWNDVPRQLIQVQGWPDEKRPYLLPLAGCSPQDQAVALRFAYEETLGTYDDERGQRRSFCAWLFPYDLNIKRLGNRLAQRAVAFPPNHSTSVVFRYWDPRLSADIPRVLGQETWQAHLGLLGLRRWISLLPRNNDVAIANLPETRSETTGAAETLAWRLDVTQWRGLEILSMRNRLIQCSAAWDLKTQHGSDDLEAVARRAFEHGLSEDCDILRFACCALNIHPEFDSHPEVAEAISSVGQTGFAEMVSDWPEDFVAELASGCWLDRSTETTEKYTS